MDSTGIEHLDNDIMLPTDCCTMQFDIPGRFPLQIKEKLLILNNFYNYTFSPEANRSKLKGSE
jgi:hypothetical protein